MSKRLTQEQFLERSIKAHGNCYNYRNTIYIKAHGIINISCPVHGVFSQQAQDHMNGHGCKKCNDLLGKLNQRDTLEQFIEKAKKVHGNKYDYSKVNYVNSDMEVNIICQEHGIFSQLPGVHKGGHGCDACAIEKNANLKRKEESVFIREATEVHNGKYSYENVNYVRTMSQVDITCPIHGSFSQQAHDHLQGHGCDDCAEYSFKKDKPAIIYYIKDITNNRYKIGITNRTVKDRFGYMMKDIKIIKTWSFDLGADAYEVEQMLHDEYSNYQIINENFDIIGGKTEFFSKDVLSLDSLLLASN